MAQQSLYRRYRPQRFSEIRGQHHVRQALQNAVREGRWSHAYLFSGPRGTGKTSTARVVAKALNCQDLGDDGEPCGHCESCVAIEQGRSFDLHELDAASHNGVSDIRDLISKVALGSPGRTKVYILDEVHMLSTGAENALLKTLEEPPEHVVFVLATTEPHKVAATIRSRTQHLEFQLLPGDELADHVRWVIEDAGLDVGDDAIDYVLRNGGGSARDTLSALELVSATGGVPAVAAVGPELARALGDGNAGASLAAVQQALEHGLEPRTIAEEALSHLRDAFLAVMGASLHHLSQGQAAEARRSAEALNPATLTRALESLGAAIVEMRQSPDPRIPLEVCLLRLTRRTGDDPAALAQRVEALEIEVAALRAAAAAPPPTPGGAAPTPAGVTAAATEAPPAAVAPQAPPAPAVPDAAAPAAAPEQADTAPPPRRQPARADQRPAPPAAPTAPRRTPPAAPRSARPADAARRTLQSRDSRQDRGSEPNRDRPAPPPPEPPGTPPPAPAPAADRPVGPSGPSATSGPSAPVPAPAADPVEGTVPALDVLESLWALEVLDALSNKARARYKPGRFVAVEDGVARFALPNPIHRDRCAELLSEVESALAAAVGSAVRLRLEVDTSTDPSTSAPSDARDNTPSGDDDIGDISELRDARDVASSGIERLTRAFPGSQVITHDD